MKIGETPVQHRQFLHLLLAVSRRDIAAFRFQQRAFRAHFHGLRQVADVHAEIDLRFGVDRHIHVVLNGGLEPRRLGAHLVSADDQITLAVVAGVVRRGDVRNITIHVADGDFCVGHRGTRGIRY